MKTHPKACIIFYELWFCPAGNKVFLLSFGNCFLIYLATSRPTSSHLLRSFPFGVILLLISYQRSPRTFWQCWVNLGTPVGFIKPSRGWLQINFLIHWATLPSELCYMKLYLSVTKDLFFNHLVFYQFFPLRQPFCFQPVFPRWNSS